MKLRNTLISAALLVLMVGAAGCVESDASLVLKGPRLQEGSSTELTYQDPESGEEVSAQVMTGCAQSTGDTATIAGRLVVDLEELGTSGQLREVSPAQQAAFQNTGDLAVLGVTEIFTINMLAENRLEASDEYSPIGSGANLRLDQNGVRTDSYDVTISPSRFDGLTGDLGFGAVVDASGGTLATEIPIITSANFEGWNNSVQDGELVFGELEVQLVGETFGGEDVESNIVRVPFDICKGCGIGVTPNCTATQ